MRSISIELVPRDWDSLKSQCEEISKKLPQINVLNVPDLMRFTIRSWDACALGKQYFPKTIPHLRAIDFNLRGRFELADKLAELGIKSVLVITGDLPQDMPAVKWVGPVGNRSKRACHCPVQPMAEMMPFPLYSKSKNGNAPLEERPPSGAMASGLPDSRVVSIGVNDCSPQTSPERR